MRYPIALRGLLHMAGFEPATSFDTGPQLPAPLTTWNTCVEQIAQKRHFPGLAFSVLLRTLTHNWI